MAKIFIGGSENLKKLRSRMDSISVILHQAQLSNDDFSRWSKRERKNWPKKFKMKKTANSNMDPVKIGGM